MADVFKVHITTWNVMSKTPFDTLSYRALLGLDDSFKYKHGKCPDAYVIGFQEINLFNISDLLIENTWLTEFKSIFKYLDKANQTRYIKYAHRRELGILICLFVRAEHLTHIRQMQFQVCRFGILNVVGNKASIGMRFILQGLPLTFLVAHLNAFAEKNWRRIQNYNQIRESTQFNHGSNLRSLLHDDCTFFFGDLNFRLEEFPNNFVDATLTTGLSKSLIEKLLTSDQLKIVQHKGQAFSEFEEAEIKFMPTYKFEIGTDVYNRKRTPSYTDRILYKKNDDQVKVRVKPIAYDCIPEIKQSDHRPIFGIFDLQIRKPKSYRMPYVDFPEQIAWKNNFENQIECTFTAKQVGKKDEEENHPDDSELDPKDFAPNDWDWVGIYSPVFYSLDDYEAFNFVSRENEDGCFGTLSTDQLCKKVKIAFSAFSLQRGAYVLLYVRFNGCVYGISNTFQVE